MSTDLTGRSRNFKTMGALGLGSAALATALVGLGSGTASADVTETAPAPYVTSRQATILSEGALRYADYGQARGFLDTRSGDSGIVHATGEVGSQPTAVGGDRVDTVLARPGTTSVPYNIFNNRTDGVGPAGQTSWPFVFGPPIGSYGGMN